MVVRVERGKLFFNETIIEKGMPVVLHSEQTKEEFYGTVTSIHPHEIYCRLADGSKTRILIAHLRSGRCSISRDIDAQN